jgi:hypothetical protein
MEAFFMSEQHMSCPRRTAAVALKDENNGEAQTATGIRYTLTINQRGVVLAGLVGKVELPALCVLNYVFGWFICEKAQRIRIDGKEYVWLDAETAIKQLPVIFCRKRAFKTRRNYLSELLRELLNVGLIETTKKGRQLYLRPSELAVTFNVGGAPNAARKTQNASTVSPITCESCSDPNVLVLKDREDSSIPGGQDKTIPAGRDDSAPANIDEQEIRDPEIIKTNTGVDAVPNLRQPLSPEEHIFNAYPRHHAKRRGIAAIRRALRTHTFEFLLERTKLFARLYDGDPRFIPYAARFFDEERFNEYPSTWKRSSTPNCLPGPQIIRADQFGTGVFKL